MTSSFGDADDELYEIPSPPGPAAKASLGFSGGGGGGGGGASNLKSLISKFDNKPSQEKPGPDIRAPNIKSEIQNRSLNTTTTSGNTTTGTRNLKTETLNRKPETQNLKTGNGFATWGNNRNDYSISTRPPLPPPLTGHKTATLGSPANRQALPLPTVPRPSTANAVHVEKVAGRKYRLLRLIPLPPGSKPPKKPDKSFHLRRLTFNN